VWLGVFSLGDYLLFFALIALANAILSSVAVLLGDQASRAYRLRDLVRLLLLGLFELALYPRC